jgi:hypothetical protein
LQTSAGTWVQVTAVRAWTTHATVHNFTLNTIHTYWGYDPASGAFHARLSGGPNALVNQFGGHAQINREVFGGSRRTVGLL